MLELKHVAELVQQNDALAPASQMAPYAHVIGTRAAEHHVLTNTRCGGSCGARCIDVDEHVCAATWYAHEHALAKGGVPPQDALIHHASVVIAYDA